MIRIRELKNSDFKDFCKNEYSYYKELKENPKFGIGTYGKKITRKELSKYFSTRIKNAKSKKWIALIAENESGHMVGEATAQGGAWFEAPHIADIGFSVIKDYRDKGVGTKLLKALIKECSRKYEIITAGVFSNNTASKRLLKRFGFVKWAKGPKFIKRGMLYIDSEFYYLRLK